MFEGLSDKLRQAMKTISGQSKMTESNIKEAIKEVKMALLEADVNYTVVKNFVSRIKEKAMGSSVLVGVNPGQQFIKIINDELTETLGGTNVELNEKKGSIRVIMLVGLQGAGKTTFAAKLAKYLKNEKNTSNRGRCI